MAITTLGAALIGGGLLGSAALSSSASKSAAKSVSSATDQAAQLQNQQFQQLLKLQMPAYQRGEQAAGLYMTALGVPSMTGQPAATQPAPAASANYGGSSAYSAAASTTPLNMTGMPGYKVRQLEDLGVDTSAVRAPIAQPGQTQPVQTPATQQPSMTQPSIADQVMQTPGYQAQLDEGLKAIDRAAPLTGGMYSGRRMKALNDYGQNTFGSYYQDWMNRIGGVAGQGQQAGQNVGQAGMNYASNAGGLMVQGANAQAQGKINSANAWSGAIGTGLGLYGGAQGWI